MKMNGIRPFKDHNYENVNR